MSSTVGRVRYGTGSTRRDADHGANLLSAARRHPRAVGDTT
ncbi:hypothetical protein ACFYPN_03670 [Streptomyces sp. NPDC005576]